MRSTLLVWCASTCNSMSVHIVANGKTSLCIGIELDAFQASCFPFAFATEDLIIIWLVSVCFKWTVDNVLCIWFYTKLNCSLVPLVKHSNNTHKLGETLSMARKERKTLTRHTCNGKVKKNIAWTRLVWPVRLWFSSFLFFFSSFHFLFTSTLSDVLNQWMRVYLNHTWRLAATLQSFVIRVRKT